jgi:hypothetical protein
MSFSYFCPGCCRRLGNKRVKEGGHLERIHRNISLCSIIVKIYFLKACKESRLSSVQNFLFNLKHN